MPKAEMPIDGLLKVLEQTHPELARVREVATAPVYLVGGAIRDLLLGRDRADLDLVVEGDAAVLAAALGAEPVEHERFSTAKVVLGGHEVDLASARTESYPRPGALPVVVPAADIEADLARRDFTINAMAIPLLGDAELIDPFRGQRDLEAGVLRVMHPRSFLDDPTRAIRAARYAARFGFELEPETEALLRASDLGSVSEDRRQAELTRLAEEETGPEGLGLLGRWGIVALRDDGVELARAVRRLLATEPWQCEAALAPAVLAAALGPIGAAAELAGQEPERPSEGVELARGRDPVELVLARAMGAEWLDRHLTEWRSVALEIDGSDLLAAGILQGPALGRGLDAALRRKLDGEIAGREQELTAALEVARGP
jgi:tRNA nucleotidyltransferase (CCA-adding enzyme)